MPPPGGNVKQRPQDKGPHFHSRMREYRLTARLRHDCPHGEQVEIQGSGSIPAAAPAPAEHLLDGQQPSENDRRREAAANLHHGVDKPGAEAAGPRP